MTSKQPNPSRPAPSCVDALTDLTFEFCIVALLCAVLVGLVS